MLNKVCILLILSIAVFTGCKKDINTINLNGEWRFELDRTDTGIKENWEKKLLAGEIKLPGSLQEQGYGNDVSTSTPWVGQIVDSAWYYSSEYEPYRQPGNIKLPFCLTPEKHYTGVAWYQREVYIPTKWQGQPVFLHLERPHWQTIVYVDGMKHPVSLNSLSVPHRFELVGLREGKHTITVRIDNRMIIDVGINSHSITDHTQTPWNGVIGDIYLETKPRIFQSDVQVFPDVKQKSARVKLTVENRYNTKKSAVITLTAKLKDGNPKYNIIQRQDVNLNIGENNLEIFLPMGEDVLLWNEFNPNVYELASVIESESVNDTYHTDFGMREIGIKGRRFTVNDTPLFLRGTLSSCIFPITGYPSMQKAYWEKIFRQVKTYGLNHVRFHSWCPPRVAFEVADIMGVYLQVECCAWALTGEGTNFDSWVFEEGDRIIKEYGNHPSFFALLSGNEPGGEHSAPLLDSLVCYWKSKDDKRRLYSSASGWPYVESADFFITPEPRIQAWGEGLKSRINAYPPQTNYDFRDIISGVNMPTVSHEIGQWCAYPNLDETSKYTGFLKAKNYEIFRDFLKAKKMEDLSIDFLMASGKLQALCYKADIETALRTPEFAGFQLLDLHDYPGHGTATVGVLDAFWDSKGYITEREYRMFCNSTVPLARMQKLIWSNDDTFEATLEVAHFEERPCNDANIRWEILDDKGNIFNQGSFTKDLPIDNCIGVGSITVPLNGIKKAKQLILRVSVEELNAVNEWNFWVYPVKKELVEKNVYITDKLDNIFYSKLKSGEKILLTLPRGVVRKEKGGDVAVGFSPIFWNSAYTSGQPPHLLGIFCNDKHPVFDEFPTSYHSDYQWWELLSNADAMILDDFPVSFRPLVHLIDDWYKNRKLGIVWEANINGAKVLVTSVDLITDIENRLSAKQFKYSLLKYVASDKFNPAESVNLSCLENLLENKKK